MADETHLTIAYDVYKRGLSRRLRPTMRTEKVESGVVDVMGRTWRPTMVISADLEKNSLRLQSISATCPHAHLWLCSPRKPLK